MNGEKMSNKSASFHETEVLGPYLFYDIMDGQELRGKNSGASSLYNEREAEAAVELLRFFKRRYSFLFQRKHYHILLHFSSLFMNNII
jgi:senataxin